MSQIVVVQVVKRVERNRATKAAGGSKELLDGLVKLLDQREYDSEETGYLLGRLIPLARDSFELALESEAKTIQLGVIGLALPFAASMVSLVSSGFVPPAYRGYSLVFLGLFSGLQILLQGHLNMTQPGLSWLGARQVFMTVAREISLWLADANDYDGLSKNEKFQLLQARCEAVIQTVEASAYRQIQSVLTVAVEGENKQEPKRKEGPGDVSASTDKNIKEI